MKSVASIDSNIKNRQAANRTKRNRKKARNAALREQLCHYAFEKRVPDSLSEREGS